MTELYLRFRDAGGEDQRILVTGDKFIVGRTPDNDLSIPDNKLSRQHLKIERFADVFVVADLKSSNGTTLNGTNLTDPVGLKNGDRLNLGGGTEIEIELVSDQPATRRTARAANSGASNAAAAGESSIPTALFIIAPVFVLVLLVCGGGLLYALRDDQPSIARNTDYNFSTPEPSPDESPDETKTPTPTPTSGNSSNNLTPPPSPEETNVPPPEINTEAKKIERHSSAFLRRIALSDDNPFLTAAQVEAVASKIGAFKSSSALAENLKAVRTDASQFETLAKSEGLTAQFLATAALAQIGNARGNPLETAKAMLPVLSGLRISLANNLADDNLLIIAAYNQGKAGKFKDLRNVLEAQAKKNPSVSPREIRTIWFLRKQGKLTDAEYDFALRFLAVGTITQNPKDFNVNAEAVIFN